MKKIYSLIATICIAHLAFSQCTINQAAFGPPNNTNYSIIPDTVANLPIAYVGVGYTADLQFHIKPDTTITQGTFPITQVQIDSIVGIPANFQYIPNPTSGTFTTTTHTPPGTGYGCVALTGLAASGQELGGPSSNGIYPLTVYFTANVFVVTVNLAEHSTITGYKLIIMSAANGISTFEASQFNVAQNSPNPADEKTDFIFNSPTSGNIHFTLYNVLGSIVKEENISATKGSNDFYLETSSLSDGIYVCSFRKGDAMITKRISVSH